MSEVKRKVGRPSLYTPELAKEICDKIAKSSLGLNHLKAENPHWPHVDTIFEWRANNAEFSEMYANAKRTQIECYINDIIEISDNTTKDRIVNEKGNEVTDTTSILRARLMVDTRKWLASKLVPKLYGDNSRTEAVVTVKAHEEWLKELA